MDYSLNIISLEKKLRFYCGDKVHIYDASPIELKNELWWSQKSYKNALNEMFNEVTLLSQSRNISLDNAKKILYGVNSTKIQT
uniref:Uncharacterized protein n=1 Tax=viral metagenome TaxID=1070528 RepID=A0A6C0BTL9_9ZZZZ